MAQVVLNQLYTNTQLQTTFGVIMLALVENQPRVLSLKEGPSLSEHAKRSSLAACVSTSNALGSGSTSAGLMVALDNLDAVIALIRGAESPVVAREELMSQFNLSGIQAQAILDMRLH